MKELKLNFNFKDLGIDQALEHDLQDAIFNYIEKKCEENGMVYDNCAFSYNVTIDGQVFEDYNEYDLPKT